MTSRDAAKCAAQAAPGCAPALAARGLAVGHGSRPFVSGIDLAVRPGELVALIGPNGTGKTTILRTVAGQLSPIAGSIEILGRDADEIPSSDFARDVASLFTERPRTELLTCKDIVEAGRYPFTGRLGALGGQDEHIVRDVMERCGVWELRGRDFAHMSDGQRQRVLIARALAQEPRLLILDEPTSFLDIRSQVEVLGLLRREARERGCAILMSIHEIALAQRAADHVVCVRDGRVVEQGAPGEVFSPGSMARLYGLDPESFASDFGSVEMERAQGAPEVFVIAGGGTGSSCFRELQRAGVPFAAGVLFEHDVDGELAASLAVRAVLAPDFEPFGDGCMREALEALAACRAVISCRGSFGSLDAGNAGIVEHASRLHLPVFSTAREYLAWRQ